MSRARVVSVAAVLGWAITASLAEGGLVARFDAKDYDPAAGWWHSSPSGAAMARVGQDGNGQVLAPTKSVGAADNLTFVKFGVWDERYEGTAGGFVNTTAGYFLLCNASGDRTAIGGTDGGSDGAGMTVFFYARMAAGNWSNGNLIIDGRDDMAKVGVTVGGKLFVGTVSDDGYKQYSPMATSTSAVNDNNFHMISIAYHAPVGGQGQPPSVMIDGVIDHAFDSVLVQGGGSGGLLRGFDGIGANTCGRPFFSGDLAAVRIYDTYMPAADPARAAIEAAMMGVAPPPSYRLGDANRDGKVDDNDLGILLGCWSTGSAWGDGDFNGDKTVDDNDLGILLGQWTGWTAAVPEPATLAMLLVSGIAALRNRRG